MSRARYGKRQELPSPAQTRHPAAPAASTMIWRLSEPQPFGILWRLPYIGMASDELGEATSKACSFRFFSSPSCRVQGKIPLKWQESHDSTASLVEGGMSMCANHNITSLLQHWLLSLFWGTVLGFLRETHRVHVCVSVPVLLPFSSLLFRLESFYVTSSCKQTGF